MASNARVPGDLSDAEWAEVVKLRMREKSWREISFSVKVNPDSLRNLYNRRYEDRALDLDALMGAEKEEGKPSRPEGVVGSTGMYDVPVRRPPAVLTHMNRTYEIVQHQRERGMTPYQISRMLGEVPQALSAAVRVDPFAKRQGG